MGGWLDVGWGGLTVIILPVSFQVELGFCLPELSLAINDQQNLFIVMNFNCCDKKDEVFPK